MDAAGVPAGVFNLVQRRRRQRRCAARRPPRRRHGVVHGLDPRRHRGRSQRGADGEARRAGARRQVGEHHPRRRRLREPSSPATWPACAPTRASRATRRRACSFPRPGWTRPRRSRPRRPRTSSSATPRRRGSNIGPVVSETQYGRIQQLIEKGIGEGAKLEVGGPGRPEGLETGYYVQPTVFSHVTNDMTIAREEIFGPVLVMIGYEDDDDAVRIANDTVYGLSGYISGCGDRAERDGPADPQRQRARQRRRPGLQRSVRWLPPVRQRPRVGRRSASRSTSRPRRSWATRRPDSARSPATL